MKNNDGLKLMVSVLFGIVIVSLFLLVNYFTHGNHLIFEKLVQGEVLTGLMVAFPTLMLWNYSIIDRNNSEKEKIENDKSRIKNEKRQIAQQALEIVKHYDEQLYDITNEIAQDGSLSLQKSSKIVYIIRTFEKLFQELNAEEETGIYLDLTQVLATVCTIRYPENLLNEPRDKDVTLWKESLGSVLQPLLKAILEKHDEAGMKMLESPSVKYFCLVVFDYSNIGCIEFKDKSFVECRFTKKFIETNKFENCEFIDCYIEG